jgi:hypothetical protein
VKDFDSKFILLALEGVLVRGGTKLSVTEPAENWDFTTTKGTRG